MGGANDGLLDKRHCIVLLRVQTLAQLLSYLRYGVALVKKVLGCVPAAHPGRVVSSNDLIDAREASRHSLRNVS